MMILKGGKGCATIPFGSTPKPIDVGEIMNTPEMRKVLREEIDRDIIRKLQEQEDKEKKEEEDIPIMEDSEDYFGWRTWL